jgi:hypothetical protein
LSCPINGTIVMSHDTEQSSLRDPLSILRCNLSFADCDYYYYSSTQLEDEHMCIWSAGVCEQWWRW